MFRYIIVLSFFMLSSTIFGQTVTDALRYSFLDPMGTARSIGVGNSMSAFGADFSAISTSPAAVGGYWTSEFVITPALLTNRTSSILQGDGNASWEENTNKLAISNLGFVIGSRPNAGAWATSNFAIGFNRINDFNQDFFYKGNSVGSITDRFLEQSFGEDPTNLSGFEEGLALEVGAIFDFNEDRIYESDYLNAPTYPLEKEQFVHSEGHHTELFFSYGANLDQKLLIGVGVSVPIFRYQESKQYIETDEDDMAVPVFNRLDYEEFLTTSAYGFQFKVGANYLPTKSFSIGLALHSPTGYNMTDDFSSFMEYSYTIEEETNIFDNESPEGTFDYKLKTPWKVIGNLGFIINRSGFITAEVHYVDYSITEFDYTSRGNGDAFLSQERDVNRQISQQLSEALTFKVGGELAIEKFRGRLGLILQQSPYINDSSFDPTYSAGIGMREDKFYIDLAFRIRKTEEGYIPYLTDQAPQQFVSSDVKNTGIYLTTGFKF